MSRFAITLSLLLAAVVFYLLGMHTGAALLFIAGGLFELAFWIRVFRKP